jgi:hypothetical protein
MRLVEGEGASTEARVGPDAASEPDDATYMRALRAELARRLTEISQLEDGVLGSMGRVDAAVAATLFVVLPIAAVLAAWRFR